jgi:hypothetical protein
MDDGRMISRRFFMALSATAAALAASPAAAFRLGRSATVGEVWGLGFLAPGASRVVHAPPNPARFPEGAWHPDFV